MSEKLGRGRRLKRWGWSATAALLAAAPFAVTQPSFAQAPPQPPPLPPAGDAVGARPVAPAPHYAVEGPYGPYSDLVPNTGQTSSANTPFAGLPGMANPYPYSAYAAAPAYPAAPYPSPPSYRPAYVPPPPPQPAYSQYPPPAPSAPPRYAQAAPAPAPRAPAAASRQAAPASTQQAAAEPGKDSHYGEPLWGYISEVVVGIANHDDSTVFARHKEPGVDFGGEIRFLPIDWLDFMASPRPNIGFHLNNHNATSQIYGGVVWEFWFWKDFFVDPAFGLSFNDNNTLDSGPPDTKQLGSNVLFREAVEVGWNFYGPHSVSVMLDHISHGHILASENEGMNTLGIQYGYRF